MSGTFIFLPVSGGGGSPYFGDPVADFASLPGTGLLGELRLTLLEEELYYWDGAAWQEASDGVLPSRTISTTTPLQGGGDLSANRTLSILQSGAAQDGYLSTADWNTFNGKQDLITAGTTAQYYRGDKTFQNLTTDVVTTSNGGSSAASGVIGEGVSSASASISATGVGLTGVWGDAHSFSVPAGRWALGGIAYLKENGAVLTNTVSAALTTTSAPGSVALGQYVQLAHLITGDFAFTLTIPQRIFTFAAPTTVYINTNFLYTSGTPHHAGAIYGWRIS